MQLQFSDTPGFCQCGCGSEVGVWERTDLSQGRVKGQPKRYRPGHHLRVHHPKSPQALEVRDRGYVMPCHLWAGYTSKDGYGRTRRNGSRQAQQVHRIYYEAAYGSIPSGFDLHHECGVPACANPEHLTPVPRTEHARRHASTDPGPRDAAGRWVAPHACNDGWVSMAVETTDRDTEEVLYLCRRCGP